MSHYTPDRWIVVKLTAEGRHHYRVFATWYGGFAGSDSWRLNSGITGVTIEDGVLHFSGSTGSIYRCHPGRWGLSGYGSGVLSRLIAGAPNTEIQQLSEDTDWANLTY